MPIMEHGLAVAQSNLGLMYVKGQGVAENPVEAAKWLRLAADQGLAVAQSKLGTMYELGRGVPQDDVAACMWYGLAAAQGDDAATHQRETIAKRMNPARIKEAEQRARAWEQARGG